MSAGKPNFQKLYEMGKLPKDQRHQIPGLIEMDKLRAENEALKAELGKAPETDEENKDLPNPKKSRGRPKKQE